MTENGTGEEFKKMNLTAMWRLEKKGQNSSYCPIFGTLDRESVKITISENKKEETIELDDKLYISDK